MRKARRLFCLSVTGWLGSRHSGDFLRAVRRSRSGRSRSLFSLHARERPSPRHAPQPPPGPFSVVASESSSRNQTVPHRWPAFPRGSTRKRSVRPRMEGERGDDGQSAKGLAPGPGRSGGGCGGWEKREVRCQGPRETGDLMPRLRRGGEEQRPALCGGRKRSRDGRRPGVNGPAPRSGPPSLLITRQTLVTPITAGVQIRHPGILLALSWLSSGPGGLLA